MKHILRHIVGKVFDILYNIKLTNQHSDDCECYMCTLMDILDKWYGQLQDEGGVKK